MAINKRKIKKFQKISMWILFLCAMVWLFFVSDMARPDELFSGVSLIVLAASFIVAVLDMLAMFVIQIIIETKIKGLKMALLSLMKNFLTYLGVGAVLIDGLTIYQQESFQIGLLRKVLAFGLIAGAGCYMGRFWTLKISDD